MRTFVAIELPDEVKRGISQVQEELKRAGGDAAWTRPEGIHLTLKFLGDVPDAKVPDILDALAVARGAGRLRIEVAGAGAFPNVKAPRVLWLGLAGDIDRLSLLQKTVEEEMVRRGFEPEDRKFAPHLTLARIKYLRPRFSWQQAIEGMGGIHLGSFEVTAVSLMKSELQRTGAVYAEIGSVEL